MLLDLPHCGFQLTIPNWEWYLYKFLQGSRFPFSKLFSHPRSLKKNGGPHTGTIVCVARKCGTGHPSPDQGSEMRFPIGVFQFEMHVPFLLSGWYESL
jgi:hypothetical protein